MRGARGDRPTVQQPKQEYSGMEDGGDGWIKFPLNKRLFIIRLFAASPITYYLLWRKPAFPHVSKVERGHKIADGRGY